ncbi:hypothetical protein D3C73_1454120 [compost metagenome]
MGFGNRVVGHLVQRLQHLERFLRADLGAVDLELFVAVGDRYLECGFYGAQVRIRGAAEVAQAGVLVGSEGVAQDHADNSRQELPRGGKGFQ